MGHKYIDADASRGEFMEAVYSILADDDTNDRANEIIDIFDTLPAADVEPVEHGEWCNVLDNYSTAGCSNCGEIYDVTGDERYGKETLWKVFKQKHSYCPNCGAKMRSEEDLELWKESRISYGWEEE